MIESAQGSIRRTVALRLTPGEDLMEGLLAACKLHNLNNGIILSAIGSLHGARFMNPIPLPDKKAGYGYGNPIEVAGPVELLSVAGMICHDDQGETLAHVHCTYADMQGRAFGGHLIEGNKVLLTVDMVLGELEGLKMGRRFDEDMDIYLFSPKQQ